MRRLQGLDATCCTTRRTGLLPTEATNWAAPSFGPEAALIQAKPLRVVMVCFAPAPFTDRLKFTGVGWMTRLRYLSKTKTMPLIALRSATGTREGRARKLRFSAGPGFTQNTDDCELLPERTMAIQRPALRSSSPLIWTSFPSLMLRLIT